MGAQTKITITHDVADVAGDLQSKGITAQNGKAQHVNWLMNLLNRIVGGASNATVITTIDKGDGVAASGTITFSSIAAADTVTVAGQVFTASASPSGNNQFLVTGGDTAAAAALAAKINGHPSLANVVSAAAVGAVNTITAAVQGPIGNFVGIAISAHGSVSGANLANGAVPTGSVSTSAYGFGL
jgi:hypothetical protein